VGHHYRLHLQHDSPPRALIKPERFSDEHLTWLFVTKLNVADWRWLKILHQVSESPPNRRLTTYQCQQAIAALILRGVIKVYQLKHLKRQGQQARYPVISTSSSEHCHFMPTAELLVHEFREARLFQHDQKQAHDFIEQLALTDKQLSAITPMLLSSFKVPPALSTASRGKQLAKLEQALVEGTVAVTVERASMTRSEQTEPELLPEEGIGYQPVSLGPHEEGESLARSDMIISGLAQYETIAIDPAYQGENDSNNPDRWNDPFLCEYLEDEDVRKDFEIGVSDGALIHLGGPNAGKVFDTSDASSHWGGGGAAIFVMNS